MRELSFVEANQEGFHMQFLLCNDVLTDFFASEQSPHFTLIACTIMKFSSIYRAISIFSTIKLRYTRSSSLHIHHTMSCSRE